MPEEWVVYTIIALALIFDYVNGFHDAANSIATVVCTRVLSPQAAVLWAAFFNFIAFLIFDTHVAAAIAKGVVDPSIVTIQVVTAGLVGAIVWNLITWYYGIPSSSSHALVGGFAGAAVSFAGLNSLVAAGLIKIGIFIIVAPVMGMLIGFVFMTLTYWIFRNATPTRVSGLFRRLQLCSAAAYSLGHGGNDAQKTMGIIMVVLIASYPGRYNVKVEKITHHAEVTACEYSASLDRIAPLMALACADAQLTAADPLSSGATPELRVSTKDGRTGKVTCREVGTAQTLVEVILGADEADQKVASAVLKALGKRVQPDIPLWVILSCHAAMGLGTLMGGWRIVKTMGQRICVLQPVHGFSAETAGTACLFGATFLGIPVSTTHTITGAILGVGSTRGMRAVKWGVAGKVMWAWVLTIPAAGGVAAATLYVFGWLGWR